MATNTNQKLAVLIDADNAQASVIQELLAEVSRYGTATIKRAYGDWTTQNLRSWKDVLHTMAIQPIQQFSYTSGKNATDSALIIDAMDVLHTGSVDGFGANCCGTHGCPVDDALYGLTTCGWPVGEYCVIGCPTGG